MRKVSLVTGSTRGIGKATIIEFAKNNGSYVNRLDIERRGILRKKLNSKVFGEINPREECNLLEL